MKFNDFQGLRLLSRTGEKPEFRRDHPQWRSQIKVGKVQIGNLRPYLAISQKRCKIWTYSYLLWNANRNSYALYLMVLFKVTLIDPNYPKPPHFQYFVYLRNGWRQSSNLVGSLIVTSAGLRMTNHP